MFSYGFLNIEALELADEQGFTSALCWHWKQSRGPILSDGR